MLLDVPVLKVEEIDLTVEGLRAHVAVLAELADLVKQSPFRTSNSGAPRRRGGVVGSKDTVDNKAHGL